MEECMTPLTILVASLVILIVDYFAERYIRVRKRSEEEQKSEESTFDWLQQSDQQTLTRATERHLTTIDLLNGWRSCTQRPHVGLALTLSMIFP